MSAISQILNRVVPARRTARPGGAGTARSRTAGTRGSKGAAAGRGVRSLLRRGR